MKSRTGRTASLSRLLLSNLALSALYFGAGLAGLLLALAPSYAAPLFLPAGISLAALVSGGSRLLPGVALGALAIELWSPLHGGAGMDGAVLLGAAGAALGATVQAQLGSMLFRRYIDSAIGAGRDVLRFVLLAPCAALTSASIAIGAMLGSGTLRPDQALPEWAAWWIGDSIGILLGAPLLWIAIGRPRPLWWRRRALLGLPLLLASGAGIAFYLQADRWEANQQLTAFRLKAQQAGDLLQAQFSEHERFIYAMARALNDPQRPLTAEHFGNLARSYLDQRPELLSLAWLRPVEHADRARFEQWARSAVAPDYTIRTVGADGKLTRAAARERYFPSTFIEPPLSRAFEGLDFLSEPVRAAALALALKSGQPTASAPLMVLRSDGWQRGMLLLQPSYAPGEYHQPMGMLLIGLQMDSYLDQVLRQVDFPDFLVRFEDLDDDSARRVMRDSLDRPAQAGDVTRQLHFGGRLLQLTLAPSAAYLRQQRAWQSWTVLTCGLALAGLLGALLLLISGERARIQAQVKDSTARLREREARLQAILDNAADAILTIDAGGVLVSANAAAGGLFGYRPEQMAGLALARLLPAAQEGGAAELLRRIAGGNSHEYQLSGWRQDASSFPLAASVSEVELPDEHLFVAILHDLTEQQRSQERIHRLAHHDALTGLANRLSLQQQLDTLLDQARQQGQQAALLFIDLDHFKKINDSHGHQTGDLLLITVAQRLRELLRPDDTIARLGGDEFIVLAAGLAPDAAGQLAARVVAALGAPYALQGKNVHSGASVGIAIFPADGDDGATLMRHADLAMYAAKSEGRGNVQFFSAAMNHASHERLQLENRLWQALEQHEFELYLQPQVELGGVRIIGAEALLRWHHPELGMVAPDRFIPIAEESGLILPLGEWVLGQAATMLARWQKNGLDQLRLAVNLSARQCHGDALLPQLDRLLARHGIPAALLELEITESAAMQDPERSRKLLRQLRRRGLRVAIDDFGTGYSSLSYLKLFEIDRIKIDRGFVKDIETDPNDAVIVGATIGLAHALGLAVVAEGVETAAQRDFLRAKGCDEAQGYLFARPMPLADFEAMVKAQTPLLASA